MGFVTARRDGIRSGARLAGICALLLALTWVVFGQTLRFPFITFDDEVYVYQNRAVLSGLSLHGIGWAFTHVVDANWHPLTVMSHMLDCTLFGTNAGGHHFSNVLLHSIGVVVLFLVLDNMTGAVWRSAFIAALFAVHPLHVESVAWVSERKDVLSGLFFFLTIGAYVRYSRARSAALYVPVFCLFALGLMCKPMLVTLPLVLLLIDYWPLRQLSPSAPAKGGAKKSAPRMKGRSGRVLLVEKLPLVALAALSCAATLMAQSKTIAAMDKLPMTSRVANAVVSVAVYLRQLFDPTHLALLYPHPDRTLSFSQIFVSLCLVVAITAFVWSWRASRPYLMTGWLWYLVMLAPVIGIVQVGLQAHADRYTYLPHIGLYIMVTWLGADISQSWPRRAIILTTASLLVLFALTVTAHQQASLWSDSIKLWQHAAEVAPNNDTAHAALSALYLERGQVDDAIVQARLELKIRPNSDEGHSRLGIAFFRKGQLDDALAEFQKVARLRPNYPDLHSNMATVLVEKGRVDEAIEEYGRELSSPREEEDPNDLSLAPGGTEHRDDALLHNNFGAALARKGRFEEALGQFGQVLAINSNYPKVHYNIGNIAMRQGDLDTAMREYQNELKIKPDFAPAHADLGLVLSQKAQIKQAVAEWEKAIELEPNNLNAACNLAWVLATQADASVRDGNKAIALAQHAVNLSGGTNPRILRLLAAAYAETGRFAQAIEVAQKAAQLAREQNNVDLAETLRRNVESFRSNLPLRD